MKIFKDIFTEAELFSDSFKFKLVDDLYYEVDGKMVSRSGGSFDAFIGSNPSAEEQDEAIDVNVEKGIDVVLNHSLIQIPFQKKDYMTYLKQYMKTLIERVEKEKGKEYADKTKEKLNQFFSKTMLPNFKNYDLYVDSREQGFHVTCRQLSPVRLPQFF
ncbi:translationally-controlled tumor protein homolog isoform X2 [Gordionus sp. m RMFG-2023]|uniref:translationally-controlled tumor protein homolog isoform X2 n=1 Tax=Gordionus sp. m RMFG-2023 TaxID=3053472 RepID=UPI0031FDC638